MKNIFNPYALSCYLAFRYIPKLGVSWLLNKKIIPKFSDFDSSTKIKIKTCSNIHDNLLKLTKKYKNDKVGILLSSGIDSAIVASYLPKSTIAYTIKFDAPNAIDESIQAAKVANYLDITHKIITVGWKDYQKVIKKLMLSRKSPLHPAEAAIHCAALQVKKEGISNLFVGSGADATFGGMDKLLSKNWEYQEFINRYNFLNPKIFLNKPADITDIYSSYRNNDSIDIIKFIKEVFGQGTTIMFENAIHTAGCNIIAPFEEFILESPLDISRIRKGEPKYLLKELYKKQYPSLKPLNKIPFARPMDQWLINWKGLRRPEFNKNANLKELTGEQKFLLFCLQEFMDLVENQDLK